MNSNLEKNQDVDHEVYETPNMGIVLEPSANTKTTCRTQGAFSQS
jgi:hypothetical protein